MDLYGFKDDCIFVIVVTKFLRFIKKHFVLF